MSQALLKIALLSQQKAFIIGLVLGVVYYFGFYDDGSAIQVQVETIQQQVAIEQQRQAESDKLIKKVELLNIEVAEQEAYYKKLSSQMPKEIQMSEVIRIVDSMATTSGVSIKGKEPKKPENKKILEEVPIRVTAEGSFSELTMFLFNVMNAESVSRITSFSIVRSTGREAKNKPLTLDATIGTYRFIGETDSNDSTVPNGQGGEK